MASFGVRVEPTVRLGHAGRVEQVHSNGVRFECPQKSSKRPGANPISVFRRWCLNKLRLAWNFWGGFLSAGLFANYWWDGNVLMHLNPFGGRGLFIFDWR